VQCAVVPCLAVAKVMPEMHGGFPCLQESSATWRSCCTLNRIEKQVELINYIDFFFDYVTLMIGAFEGK